MPCKISLPGNCGLELCNRTAHAFGSELIGWQLLVSYWLQAANLTKLAKRTCVFAISASLALPSFALAEGRGFAVATCLLASVICLVIAAHLLRGFGSETLSRRFSITLRLAPPLILLFAAVFAKAQATPDVEQGMKPYGSYHGGDLDKINLTNGNLFFHADLFAYSQRGGELKYPISLQYNGKVFSVYQTPCPPGTTLANGCMLQLTILFGPNPLRSAKQSTGNSVTVGYEGLPGVGQGFIDTGLSFDTTEIIAQPYSVVMPDGSVRQMATTDTGIATIDGSGYFAPTNGLLRDQNGTKYTWVHNYAEDRNGNQILTNSGNWVDTLGRTIPPAPGIGPGTPNQSTASLSSCPALNYSFQPVTYAYTWNLPTANGGTLPLIVCYTSVFVRTNILGITAAATGPKRFDVDQAFPMLQSVVFPDNTYWAFEYDAADPNNTTSFGFGDLLKIILPTGGSLSYTFEDNPTGCGLSWDRAVKTRTVDDGTGSHQWTYSYGAGNPDTVTITDPLGNDTVHTITGLGTELLQGNSSCSLYETKTQYYQGSQSGGTLLKTVNTDYQYTSNPYDPGLISDGAGGPTTVTNVFPIRVTTTLPNGLVSKTETDYDTALVYHGPLDGITWNVGCPTGTVGGTKVYAPSDAPPNGACNYTATQTNAVTTYTGSYGKVIATREYDWGQGAPGPLLRKTSTSYQWQSNSNYLTNNFLDLVASTTTFDGAGHQVAQTTYGYDESTLGTSGISTQHNGSPANGAYRGNQTSVHHWLSSSTTSTSNCPIAVSNGSLVSYAQYNDTGTVASTTDPCGTKAGDSNHTTTHTYSSTYAGAYPTQTCNPLGQCVNGVYDSNTGLLTSFTDANNQTTTYTYDNYWRMTQALFPVADSSGVHPETDFDYSVLNQVKRSKKQASNASGTTWIYDYAYFDGLGRTIQTRLVDPEGDDFVDTTYDGLGRVSTVSNPHRSTSSTTDGITTTYYDALSRVVQIAPQDGTVLASGTAVTQCQGNNTCTDYSNFPTVTVTDEAGKVRRSRTDALGRLVEVDEPGAGVNGPGTPGSGTISISGSLYSSTTSGTKATGWFSVSGSDNSVLDCGPGGLCNPRTSPTVWDSGPIDVTINGVTAGVVYGKTSTQQGLASSLASQLSPHPVTYSDPGTGTISVTADVPGPNYSLSATASSNDPTDFGSGSFTVAVSGPTLTGGVYPVTTYDSGTVTVTVDGFTASAAYSQTQNSTASAVASALAASLNASGSPVTATVSGTTITLIAKAVGTGSNYSVSGSSTVSFTASSTTLSGATNPGGIYAPFVTSYTYDTLGDLTNVNQAGDGSQAARVRSFSYDSLSRLLTATNPESGTISYVYDADGNMLQKASPAPNVLPPNTGNQVISFCYDVLNRVQGKGYGAQSCPLSTPAVTYTYDIGANGIGRLTSLTDQAGAGSYTFDPLGRTVSESRTINDVTKGMGYAYNLDSSLATVVYPSGSAVNYQYTTAGRLGAAQDLGNNINYVNGVGGPGNLVAHTPDGSPVSYVNGYVSGGFSGISNAFTYNPRLQPLNMSASSPNTSGTDSTATVTISGELQVSGGGGFFPQAAADSPLSSVVYPDGSPHTFFVGTDHHIYHLSWSTSAGWQTQDLTSLASGTLASSGTGLTSIVNAGGCPHAFYIDVNQHVSSFWLGNLSGGGCGASWIYTDMTVASGAANLAQSNSPLSSVGASSDALEEHFYFGANNHLYRLWWNSNAVLSNQDLTTLTNGPAVGAGSGLASIVNQINCEHVFYLDASGHLRDTFLGSGGNWSFSDLTASAGATPALTGSMLSTVGVSADVLQEQFYIGTNNHLYRLYWPSSGGIFNQDLTALKNGPNVDPNRGLGSLLNANDDEHIFTFTSNGHMWDTWLGGGATPPYTQASDWGTGDLSSAFTTFAAPGSKISATGVTAESLQTKYYVGPEGHLYRIYIVSSGTFNQDMATTAITGDSADSGTVSLTAGGFTATVCYGHSTNPACAGQPVNLTAMDVAAALAQAFNTASSPATATVNGTTINLVWKTAGAVDPSIAALSTTHDQPSVYTNPSFTSTATSFTGGEASPTIFSLNYDFHLGAGNNGNVFGITNNKDSSRNQTFTYDQLNRLISAQNTGTTCSATTVNGRSEYWGNSYGYDAWGNLLTKTVTKCGAENLTVTADTQNRMHATSGQDYQYDIAGNMTFNATPPVQYYTYDAENRISGAGGYTYVYDRDGNRMAKVAGDTGTLYWYMSPGIVAESDLSGNLTSEYVFFNGERVARRDFPGGEVSYYFSDHLKTTDIVTDAQGNIKNESDFYPWGGELQFSNNDFNHYKFTGKERDTETGLDYFGARYYSNGLGRFVTPDWAAKAVAVPYAQFGDPQSLNLYGYVRSVPTTLFDIDGHGFAEVWQDIKDGLSQISVKATIGLGIGGKMNIGPGKARAELALKANLEMSGSEGRVKYSESMEGGVSVGKGKTEVGLAGSVEQVKASVDMRTGDVHGPEDPKGEKVVGLNKGENSVSAGSDKVTIYGAEVGGDEGLLGGGEISITKDGLNSFKAAYSELKQTLLPAPPPPPPPPTRPLIPPPPPPPPPPQDPID